jgi:hypothetical protein
VRTLTKEQVQKLTPDQQVAVATMEAEHVRARQRLIERAGPSKARDIVVGLLMGVAAGLAVLSTVIPRALPLSIITLVGLVGVITTGINRRLDALLQLLHPDASGLPDSQLYDTQRAPSSHRGPSESLGSSGVGREPSVS